jgi:hypothetical protein
MAAGSQIGFHAAYDAQSGQERGYPNACIGAYLNRIGLTDDAVTYITAAPPNSMTWLRVADAKQYGIDTTLLDVVCGVECWGNSNAFYVTQALARLNDPMRFVAGLPATIAALPAVIALQRSDPAAFGRFSKRFTDGAANAPEDALLSLARSALRQSVKRQLANAPADALVEITQVYLAYMQALQMLSPESCVALSDDSKGANLRVNLAQQLPVLFGREMAVLERVAEIDPAATVAAPTADQARKYIDKVYMQLHKQPVQSELLGGATLAQLEFMPYCRLVVAFYQTVLTLPPEDRINLLRYLYERAAAE